MLPGKIERRLGGVHVHGARGAPRQGRHGESPGVGEKVQDGAATGERSKAEPVYGSLLAVIQHIVGFMQHNIRHRLQAAQAAFAALSL